MEIGERVLPPDHDLILASDFHEGTVLQEERALYEMRDKVRKDKNTFLAFGGDAVEAIAVDDKRYCLQTDKKKTPLQQYRFIQEEFFRPIASKVIFIVQGNHDWTLARTIGDYLEEILCPTLKIPYGTVTAKWTINDKKGRKMYKLFNWHGKGNIGSVAPDPIREEANMLLQLKRKLSKKAGDCEVMVMGHTHKLMIARPMSNLYLRDDGEKIRSAYTGIGMGESQWIHPDHRWYVNSGSFLKLYGLHLAGYGERAGYDPVELGYAVLECRDGKIKNIRKEVVA